MREEPKIWKCSACGVKLAYVEGDTVRIKRKDLYIEIQKGTITTNCTLCGKRQELPYEMDYAVKTTTNLKEVK